MTITQLSRGMSGTAVAQMQNDLVDLGFSLPSYGVDGQFGSETEQAVRNFQYTYKITVDGIVGPETAAAIKEALDLLQQGQWNPSTDPLQAPTGALTGTIAAPTTVVPLIAPSLIPSHIPTIAAPAVAAPVPSLAASLLGEVDWKWIGLGILGILIFIFISRKSSPAPVVGRRRRKVGRRRRRRIR